VIGFGVLLATLPVGTFLRAARDHSPVNEAAALGIKIGAWAGVTVFGLLAWGYHDDLRALAIYAVCAAVYLVSAITLAFGRGVASHVRRADLEQ
jgi:hypothetical protein